MIMNALNGDWSDTQILQTIIRKESQKLIKILQRDLILTTENFQSKLETFIKQKKRIPSILVFLAMKIKKNIQSMYQNNTLKEKVSTYY